MESDYPDQCRYDERVSATDDDSQEPHGHPSVSVRHTAPNLHSHQSGGNDSLITAETANPVMRPQEHVRHLEARLRYASNAPSNLPTTPISTSNSMLVAEGSHGTVSAEAASARPLIQGASFKTQFHGVSHSVNIIGYFDGLRGFLKRTASNHPVLGAHRWAVQTLSKSRQLPTVPPQEPDEVLRRLLPCELLCRPLIISYLKHFEGMFRIIHGPSFWRRYDSYWAGSIENSSPFVALLLAAMSCARCLFVDDPISFDGDSSSARAEAVQWVYAVEAWHDKQSPKHTTVEIFQIKCLLLLSKKLNAIKIKRHYTVSQTLLASAISVGLHRSPTSLGVRASVYDKELRRRLWATVAELDLAESIERGVPSMVANLHSDIEPPGNFRDEDFDESSTDEPVTQRAENLTLSSVARYAHSLRPLRHSINNLVNNPEKHKALDSTELNSYHEQIFSRFFQVRSLPKGYPSTCHRDSNHLGSTYLELQLHELLIMLHLPFALGKFSGTTSSHSRFICSGSAKSVINIYARLPDQGLSQMCLPRTNIIRATLCLCLVESTAIGYDTIYSTNCGANETVQLVDRALNLVEERILALGDGFRGLWLLFAASCFIEPHKDPAVSAVWQEKIINRIIVLCSKICLCQVDRSQNGDTADALFARYMKHIQRTSVYAKVDTSITSRDGETALHVNDTSVPELSNFNPLMEGVSTDDWLSSALNDFGSYEWADT